MTINAVREYVNKACMSDSNRFGPAFFDQHLLVVLDYAGRLAGYYGADKGIVSLSAYLHDISAVLDFSSVSSHDTAGAGLAKNILADLNCPQEKIEAVCACILSHSSPVTPGNGTLEEVCISNADAVSQITNPAYWLYFAFNIRGCSFKEGREWLLGRIEGNWVKLVEPAKELIGDKYLLAREFLYHTAGRQL